MSELEMIQWDQTLAVRSV